MPPSRRRFTLAGKIGFVVLLHVLVTSAVSAMVALFFPEPVLVFSVAAMAGLVLAAWSVHRFMRSAQKSLDALSDGVRSLHDADYSLRLAASRQDELGDLAALYNSVADALRGERQAIQQRELLLDTVLQGAPIAIVLTGATGRIVFSNRAARHLFREGRRLEGEDFSRLIDTGPVELRDALAQDGDSLFTVPQGEEEETYRAARRVFHLNGRRHVLTLVERLTPELRRREVEVWKKVIRVMSHEMNNSLAPIGSLARSARLAIHNPEHAHRLEEILVTIEERATHLAEFLGGYAHFARLPRPNKQEVQWQDFLEGVRRLSPFRLEGVHPAALGWFDPLQIQQVLINLLKNAQESGSRPSEITLSVHAMNEGGSVIRVMDRGKGMTENDLAQALIPFYSSKPRGTGLGLPLCSEIVEAHGGRLSLQNREGGGMVVTCLLPGRPAN